MDLKGRWGLDLTGSGLEQMAVACEHSNEPSGTTIGWEFFEN
jgi:hypothetical protein